MRAAAEMKKTAATQQSTTGSKGMMGVILPMYAVGIVLYLIYTLTKVSSTGHLHFISISSEAHLVSWLSVIRGD